MNKVYLTSKADKDLSKHTISVRNNVLAKLKKLKTPFPIDLDIKKLTYTEGFYRLRIGKIRVIFEIDSENKDIWIRKIAYRKDVYR